MVTQSSSPVCLSPVQAAEPSLEDLNLDKKESEVEVSLEVQVSSRCCPGVQVSSLRETPPVLIGPSVSLCVQEAKAIIAQRSGNPREFFKQKERAMTISVDTSPVSVHRTGKDLHTDSGLAVDEV